jgi:KAP-like P-loop domain-containing protein
MAIAERLKLIRIKNQHRSSYVMSKAFFININGHWGSGKSSLLELIKKKLTSSKTDKWIVVYYNAWQHQRIHPSWWVLMDIVYKKSVSELRKSLGLRLLRSLLIRLREIGWRFRVRNISAFLIILAIVLALTGIFLVISGFYSYDKSYDCWKMSSISQSYDPTKGGAGAISFIISLFTGIFGLRQSLITGSRDAAEDFVRQTSDPMEKLSSHFESLINWIKDPVIIFIDDLDRCTGEYTVEFLEGVQTLFRKPNVIVIIAADRHWICTSYEKIYNTFNTAVEEQFSPLGYQFLDKIFQLSITVPSMTERQQKAYLKKLIKKTSTTKEKVSNESSIVSDFKILIKKALEKFKLIKKTSTTKEKVSNESSIVSDLEEHIKDLNSPDAESETREFLSEFSYLLDRNPRAMKKLVNAYGIMRDKGIIKDIIKIKGMKVDDEDKLVHQKLVRWTILNSRWPILAEYLEDHPTMIKYVYGNDEDIIHSGIPNNLQGLFQDGSVRNVVGGKRNHSYR